MEVLSDVFKRLRLQGDVYFTTDFAGGWGVRVPCNRRSIRFHLVIHGQCWVEVDGGSEPSPLREGEFALIPHGASQRLLSSPGSDVVPLETLFFDGNPDARGTLHLKAPGSGHRFRALCGYCRFDEAAAHPLVLGLPPMIHMSTESISRLPWLNDAIRVTTLEANIGEAGMQAIVSRLIEILVMQGLRSYDNPFLRAIHDEQIGHVLEAMHERPAHDWTLSSLAKCAAMSRTQLARRFKDALQQSPIQYLIEWRLQTARQLLKESDLNVEEVALRVGYESLPSFSRRFKKRYGVSPALYRRQSMAP